VSQVWFGKVAVQVHLTFTQVLELCAGCCVCRPRKLLKLVVPRLYPLNLGIDITRKDAERKN